MDRWKAGIAATGSGTYKQFVKVFIFEFKVSDKDTLKKPKSNEFIPLWTEYWTGMSHIMEIQPSVTNTSYLVQDCGRSETKPVHFWEEKLSKFCHRPIFTVQTENASLQATNPCRSTWGKLSTCKSPKQGHHPVQRIQSHTSRKQS